MIGFEDDQTITGNRLMVCSTYAKRESGIPVTKFSRIETDPIFREGTYLAKVKFDYTPIAAHDGNVETFYVYNGASPYSEFDFEYLPYDVWDKNKQELLSKQRR